MSPRPLLAVDRPNLLFRAFFALPRSITGRRRPPAQRPAGHGEPDPAGGRALRPARRRPLLRRRGGAPTARSSCPRYHADRPPLDPDLAHQFELSDRVLLSVRAGPRSCTTRSRPTTCSARWRRARSRPAARRCCSPATATCSSASPSDVTVLFPPAARTAPRRSAPPRCASATASSPSRCPTSSPCAATRPTAFPGANGDRGEDGARAPAARTARWRARSPTRPRAPRVQPAPARGSRAAARVQGNRDAASTFRWSGRPTGPIDVARRRRGRPRARDEPPRRATGAASPRPPDKAAACPGLLARRPSLLAAPSRGRAAASAAARRPCPRRSPLDRRLDASPSPAPGQPVDGPAGHGRPTRRRRASRDGGCVPPALHRARAAARASAGRCASSRSAASRACGSTA